MFYSQDLQKLSISGVQGNCPLCKRTENQDVYCTVGLAPMIIRSYAIVDRALHESTFRHCNACDFGYFYPLPNDAFFRDFYSTENNTHGQSMADLMASRQGPRGMPNELPFILSHKSIDWDRIRQERSLDVGCGEGDFIGGANENGFHFEGLDPVKLSCDFVEQRYNTKAFCGMLDDVPETEHGQFSLITSLSSLEHHTDPVKTLRKFHALLREEGCLFISVPNLNSYAFQKAPLIHPYFAFPPHVNYFSATALRTLLEALGFTDIDITSTTDAAQVLYCWDAPIRLGMFQMTPAFFNELSKQCMHEYLHVFAVKKAS